MRAPRNVGTIHGYTINKQTPALLTASQTGSARDRQHRQHLHHSPVTAALSTRVLLSCETTVRLYQKKNALFRATVSADSQPASRYAARSAWCTARCSAGQKKTLDRPFHQLAATQCTPPGVQPAARPNKKKNARSPFSGPQFLPTCYKLYVVVVVNTDIPHFYLK
jgi:hypothetical protein